MKINIEPRIKRISGVGNIQQFGANYSMRIWMKPDKMAQYKLIPPISRQCWSVKISKLLPELSARITTTPINIR